MKRSFKQKESSKHNWNKAVIMGSITNFTKMINTDSRIGVRNTEVLKDAVHKLNAIINCW